MALQILNAPGPDPETIAQQMREKIEAALPGAQVEVRPQGPGHFEVSVRSDAFEGKNRVKQQQLVYGAIADMMSGKDAPVHAIDRMECLIP